MKIALIEDRLERLERFVDFDLYNCREVEIISGTEFDLLINDLSNNNTDKLNQFDCISSHRSALSNTNRDILKKYCKINKKPLIFFSGGISSSVYKNEDFTFLHINSREFYSNNLKLFIEDNIKKGSVNLLVLQFGNRWKLSLLLSLRNKIAIAQNKQNLKIQNPDIDISENELIKRERDLQINTLVNTDLFDANKMTFLTGNEYETVTTEQIDKFSSVLNHLINDVI